MFKLIVVVMYRYPVYILEHLRILPISEAARKEQASLLMYLSYMFQLFGMRAADLRKKGKISSKVSVTYIACNEMLN